MAKIDYAAMDRDFFSHPFKAQVLGHHYAEKAFRGSKLSKLANTSLMYVFVTGARHELATNMVHTLPVGGDLNVQPSTSSSVSIQAIRGLFAKWRSVLFRNPVYLEYILLRIGRVSSYAQGHADEFASVADTFVENVLDPAADKEEAQRREHFWHTLRHCFYECGTGLNVGEHKRRFGSVTAPDMNVVRWRAFLEGNATIPHFADWKQARVPELEAAVRAVGTAIKKNHVCGRCPNRSIRVLPNYFIQSMFSYLGRFRIKDAASFHDHFFSALIYAYCQSEIWSIVQVLEEHRRRWDVLLEAEKESWHATVFAIDHNFARLANTIVGAMIECLAHANSSESEN